MTIYKNTRDIQDRIEELSSKIEGEIGEALITEYDLTVDCESVSFLERLLINVDKDDEGADFEDYEVGELIDLLKFKENFENYNTSWGYAESVIHHLSTEEYFEEMCIGDGIISRNLPDFVVIDWEQTAQNLLADYTEGTIGDETYYFRVN